VAGTVGTDRHSNFPRITLNSDGQRHPLLNPLSVSVFVIGLVSGALGIFIRNISHPALGLSITAGVTGLVVLVVGLCAQMNSATREQRVLLVTGMICGFVGLALGVAHGGFAG
jgi:uncharacterized membrane protein HdeD (DUF308 family)